MSRITTTAAAAALLVAAACSTDRSPTAVNPPVPTDLTGSAYKLTIEVASGRITVAPPAGAPGSAANASLSLMGSEAIALQAGSCTWSSIPGNSKQKRCRFDLTIKNRLAGVDLLTPTSLPQPAAGVHGVLVFPFTSASLGTPSSAAVPTADWDNAPANFFNDFGGCPKGNDCYRSESYASPVFAGESSEARTVGFDVDKNAQTVAAYIVVAADLRDAAPAKSIVIAADERLCGTVLKAADGTLVVAPIQIIRAGTQSGGQFRAACSFTLPPNIHVTGADLHLDQGPTTGSDPFASGNTIVVDHLAFGAQFEASIFDLAPIAANIGTLTNSDGQFERGFDVTASVKNDVLNGRGASQFRFQFLQPPADGYTDFTPPGDPDGPRLTVRYREL